MDCNPNIVMEGLIFLGCFLTSMHLCFNMMGVTIQLYPLVITWASHSQGSAEVPSVLKI